MAPEQRQAPHEAVASSDVYAFGISWYEMLTQQTPDPTAVGAGEFPEATSNAEVQSVIKKMLSFRPTNRLPVDQLLKQVVALKAQFTPCVNEQLELK
jgi:serine/threonine protein kinase